MFPGNALLRRLVRIGVLDESRMKLDYVLGLKIEDFLERRLQTQVTDEAVFWILVIGRKREYLNLKGFRYICQTNSLLKQMTDFKERTRLFLACLRSLTKDLPVALSKRYHSCVNRVMHISLEDMCGRHTTDCSLALIFLRVLTYSRNNVEPSTLAVELC